MNIYRHGDLALVEVEKLPDGLEEANTDVALEGRTSTHRVVNGKLYFKQMNDFVFGYLVAGKGTKLTHPEHGDGDKHLKEATIPRGIYELRRQQEFTHEGMRAVLD